MYYYIPIELAYANWNGLWKKNDGGGFPAGIGIPGEKSNRKVWGS